MSANSVTRPETSSCRGRSNACPENWSMGNTRSASAWQTSPAFMSEVWRPQDNRLHQVTLCECPPRAGLQVLLEAHGARLVGELNEGNQSPGAIRHRVTGATGIVHLQSSFDVGGQSDVIPAWLVYAAQDIDDPPRWSHAMSTARRSPFGISRSS